MTKRRPDAHPDLANAFHIASTHAGQLRAAGAKRVLTTHDSVDMGPVSLDWNEHLRLRKAYWRNFQKTLFPKRRANNERDPLLERLSRRGIILSKGEQRVFVWLSRGWSEQLFVAMVLHALSEESADVWFATPAQLQPLPVPRTERDEIAAYKASVREGFANAFKATPAAITAGSHRWRAFVAGDLGALDREHPAPIGPIPDAARMLIPRVQERAERVLGLSTYDHMLLGMFSDGQWSTTRARMCGASRPLFFALVEPFGDLNVLMRLEAWAHATPDILERRRGSPPRGYGFSNFEYRLTPAGVDLVASGRAPAGAPQMSVGGLVTYSPAMQWACGPNGSFIRLRRSRAR